MDLQQQDVNGLGEYFINSGVQNFGVKGRTDREAKVFSANTLTIDFFGNVYYRPFPYKLATHNHVFSLTGEILRNELVGLYIMAQMSYLNKLYSFNNMGTWPRIKEQIIHLPVTTTGNIDFVYIEERVRELEEERVRELEEERVRELEAYLSEAGFDDCTLTDAEKNVLHMAESGQKEMHRFDIVEKFRISNSHNILKSDVVFGSGTTPYVTASEGNNSIVSYISYKPEMMEQGNTIMIGGKTLIITYQPRHFFSNDSHNLVLTVKDERGRNESTQLYMVAALYKTLGPKYSWGDSISKSKIQKDVVYLPVTDNGRSIDYAFMETYISAIKKLCIARLKQEIEKERKVYGQVIGERKTIELNKYESHYSVSEFEPLMAAEPFECYSWNRFDQQIIDFFGGDKTILVGCSKDKRHHDWILSHNIYNVRLGDTKGSMEKYRNMFGQTSLLVLYDFKKPDKFSAYSIKGNKEMSKQELLQMGYPNPQRKRYMTFQITPIEMDLSLIANQHLIEKLIEMNPPKDEGTPAFIEP